MSSNVRNRRRLLAFYVACVLVLFMIGAFVTVSSGTPAPPSLRETKPSAYSSSSGQTLLSDVGHAESQSREWAKDFNRYGFTATQCSSEFRGLFHEIERAVAHRNRVGNVKETDIDLAWKPEGAVRAMIYNQKVNYPVALQMGWQPLRSRS